MAKFDQKWKVEKYKHFSSYHMYGCDVMATTHESTTPYSMCQVLLQVLSFINCFNPPVDSVL